MMAGVYNFMERLRQEDSLKPREPTVLKGDIARAWNLKTSKKKNLTTTRS